MATPLPIDVRKPGSSTQQDDDNAQAKSSSQEPNQSLEAKFLDPEDTAQPPLLPDEFMLGRLRDGRLRVVKPIEVVRTAEDGQCVLEARELNEFGFGDNFSEALADLQAAIAELYFTLEAEQDHLGTGLAAVWATLSEKVSKVHAN